MAGGVGVAGAENQTRSVVEWIWVLFEIQKASPVRRTAAVTDKELDFVRDKGGYNMKRKWRAGFVDLLIYMEFPLADDKIAGLSPHWPE